MMSKLTNKTIEKIRRKLNIHVDDIPREHHQESGEACELTSAQWQRRIGKLGEYYSNIVNLKRRKHGPSPFRVDGLTLSGDIGPQQNPTENLFGKQFIQTISSPVSLGASTKPILEDENC